MHLISIRKLRDDAAMYPMGQQGQLVIPATLQQLLGFEEGLMNC